MDGKLKISFEEVNDKAVKIEKLNNSLYETLTAAAAAIEKLQNTAWVSATADTVYEKIKAQRSTNFENYKTIINQYVTFLRTMVSEYQQLENTLNTNADNTVKNADRFA